MGFCCRTAIHVLKFSSSRHASICKLFQETFSTRTVIRILETQQYHACSICILLFQKTFSTIPANTVYGKFSINSRWTYSIPPSVRKSHIQFVKYTDYRIKFNKKVMCISFNPPYPLPALNTIIISISLFTDDVEITNVRD